MTTATADTEDLKAFLKDNELLDAFWQTAFNASKFTSNGADSPDLVNYLYPIGLGYLATFKLAESGYYKPYLNDKLMSEIFVNPGQRESETTTKESAIDRLSLAGLSTPDFQTIKGYLTEHMGSLVPTRRARQSILVVPSRRAYFQHRRLARRLMRVLPCV